jgi:hypothetical protein
MGVKIIAEGRWPDFARIPKGAIDPPKSFVRYFVYAVPRFLATDPLIYADAYHFLV